MSSCTPCQQDQPSSSSTSSSNEQQDERVGTIEPHETANSIEVEDDQNPPTPPSPTSGRPAGQLDSGYLNDLPSLTPSKLATSVSDSDSDSIPERFTDDDSDEPGGLLDSLSLAPSSNLNTSSDLRQSSAIPHQQRTPSSQSSLGNLSNSHISLSEPAPIRNPRISRKRSLSALVALRYRGGKGDAEIGDEERGLLALDLDTYINSGEPEIPETRALPPSALFPTLSTVIGGGPMTLGGIEKPASGRGMSETLGLRKSIANPDEPDSHTPGLTISLHPDSDPLLPTPRSEWPFGGGTGPGKTSRGFIPGRSLNLLSPTTPTPTSASSISNPSDHPPLGSDLLSSPSSNS